MSKFKRLIFLSALIPVSLMALETVNLIKNHSFEKDDSSWRVYTGTFQEMEDDSAKAICCDSTAAFTGNYSASIYTSSLPGDSTPPGIMADSGVVIQALSIPKALKDLDSFTCMMKIEPSISGFEFENHIFLSFLFDMRKPDWLWCLYNYRNPNYKPWGNKKHRKVYNLKLQTDTAWRSIRRSIKVDWVDENYLSPELILDSFALVGAGVNLNTGWHGQKVYFDDIRLMGYADYDVGVKEILSPDTIGTQVNSAAYSYTPVARIKNFGRKDANSFLVIAELRNNAGTIFYTDTVSKSLSSDTEDTVEFTAFATMPSKSTLVIRTVMNPDESDADDELSKQIIKTGIEDDIETYELSLNVIPNIAGFQVSYSLPCGEHGVLSLYDASGRRIGQEDVNGTSSVNFNAGYSSGVYFVQLKSRLGKISKKAVVIR